MTTPEVRLERLRPDGIAAALDRAPIAWIPLGALEFHADHLPNGTDGLTGHGLLVAAAERIGGVVLPWSYLTMGTLALPWSFRFDPGLVEEALRQTLRQLPAYGVRLAVVHTGHAPLDLNHLIKRVCAGVAAEGTGLLAMGLCYLELNAVLGTGLGTDWPVAVDHGSTMETSWVAALAPDLVEIDRLPADPAASLAGVYGPNPRFTVDPGRGAAQIDAAATLLAERALAVLRGEPYDPLADLRAFVERYWPERLDLAGRAGAPNDAMGGPAILLTNPGPVSRYLSGLSLRLDGVPVSSNAITLLNATPGETGVGVRAADLGPEHGSYIRRHQTAEVRLPDPVAAGPHEVELVVSLAGVTETVLAETVEFR
ncbi:MAG: creatinine amidohydrolase [Chloroflexota bacterium]|nr:creatinine amidohydrolase [Chloroflexota bacterium]